MLKELKAYIYAAIAFALIIAAVSAYAWHSDRIEELKTEQYNAGQDSVKTEVETAKNTLIDENRKKLLAQEADFAQRLLDAQQAASKAADRMDEIRGIAKGQHEEINTQASDLLCTIPDATIDTLNRPIRIGAGASPLLVPKKEAGPPKPAVPSAPPKGGSLPTFLQPKK